MEPPAKMRRTSWSMSFFTLSTCLCYWICSSCSALYKSCCLGGVRCETGCGLDENDYGDVGRGVERAMKISVFERSACGLLFVLLVAPGCQKLTPQQLALKQLE